MTQIAEVLQILVNKNGQITNEDVKNAGFSTAVLSRMVDQEMIERIAPGVYVDPMSMGDDLASIQYRFAKGIYCMDTALFLHGMIDRTPDTYKMNFPLDTTPPKNVYLPLKTYRQSNHLYPLGIEEVQTPGGNSVKTYNKERTLCDILRPKTKSDPETIKQAMVSYACSSNKNLNQLAEYSKIFKVEKQIRNYMEVLL